MATVLFDIFLSLLAVFGIVLVVGLMLIVLRAIIKTLLNK